ncbi:VOC family protein [Paenarthrobacter sp. NPDC092416]|uniref:VOC family protein n=1 Tax=Paenarthrobacter sp. NPDC092416 TaxID=3364386 RepID=UPI003827DF7B
MPKPDIIPGSPCWIDLMTSDTEKAKAFYNTLFGWTYETGDQEKYGGYITASKDGQMVAGIMQKQEDMGAMPDVWSTYLRTDDINATTEAAKAHGGQVFLEPMEVPEQGSMAMYGDTSGASIGAWQFGEMKGYEVAAEAGAPAWHELLSKNYESAVSFYQDVFGWETSVVGDTPEFRYTTLGAGDDAKAGIMDASGFLPEQVPSMWSVYFAVADVDSTIEQALALGATTVQPAEDTPFGRLATLSDPTGAVFKLVQDLALTA